MNQGFQIIAITAPNPIKNEVSRIIKILETGEANILHIRKPQYSKDEIKNLIQQIPEVFYNRIKLHDAFELIDYFNLRGAHLNSRNPIYKGIGQVSRSLHSVDKLNYLHKNCKLEQYEYVTLSPIFNSISKPEYYSNYNIQELAEIVKNKKVIALGGVTPDKFEILKASNFYGCAMLGYFWTNN